MKTRLHPSFSARPCLFLVLLFILLASLSLAAPPNGYELVWSDEFSVDGPPDPTYWDYEYGFVRNNELQWYQPENAICESGLLVIEGRREQVANPNYAPGSSNWKLNRQYAEYTSASVRTKGKFSWQYGILEVRARIDVQNGMWPAIWTLGIEGEWPSNGECDIMEYYSGDILANCAWGTQVRWTPKWDTSRTPLSHFTNQDPDWVSKFHTWRMEWDSDYIRLYLDDELLNETALSGTINGDGVTNPFRQPHYLILNLALGSNGGNPANSTFPTRYEIDWVRLYQKTEDLATWQKIDDRGSLQSYDEDWGTWDGNPGYLGTEHFSETTNAEVTFSFTGNRARWYGFRRNDLGFAEVILNGVSQGLIDCYAASAEFDVLLFETPELPDTDHTLTIRVAGTANPASSGNEVIVDAFAYRRGVAGEPWQRRWFTDTQINETPAATASLSDGDLDGVPALIEALFGGDPNDPAIKPETTTWMSTTSPDGSVHYVMDRLLERGDITATVEYSIDLSNWFDISTWADLGESQDTSPLPGYERIHYELPLTSGSTHLFLRNKAVE
jgi:beta-glucanase (GH16 family)